MEKYRQIDAKALEDRGRPDGAAARRIFQAEYTGFSKKIIVLDDDPTGTQTVHDVSVYTDWSYESILEGFCEDRNMFFLLTNSRSFSEEKTKQVHREIGERIVRASRETKKDFLVISRGDSTLRGHYPLEMEVLGEALKEYDGRMPDGEILCPFFKEGGRYTIDSVHYVQEKGKLIPAAQTEFAGDATFGYSHSELGEYVEEKSRGRKKSQDCIRITLDMLRGPDLEVPSEKLLEAGGFSTVLVDAVCYEDVEIFCAALLKALKAGKRFLIRSAAAVPKVLGNIADKPLLGREELIKPGSVTAGGTITDAASVPGGIVLAGSHVKKTTVQLERLREADCPLSFLEFNVNTCFQEEGLSAEADRITDRASEEMKKGNTAVVYTSRELFAPAGYSKEELLKASVRISDAVTSVIQKLTVRPRFIIAKGGITSSDVAVKALAIKKAVVMGQIQPGIPVWMTGSESKFPGMPYVIFPGNVGGEDTLKKVVETLSRDSEEQQ
ncbi:four-carbon acid sugar kinase family protein [Murimonas intestini]|uniref:Uncharacterized protein YgbK (DUF1537 family) n=1 Tax=Murimonas intestini TaxID=1337051 RepID=A0AB73T742_9FIRM|nr:four-carbon acid sugar kinase family protein [Murimonas intestini]MCR1841321.1 hydroxyacid dehydrogenase [Murimonas intestini]MCR1866239.1 hydroxyacid dehydrogenase [Murimonas intestini]MCR1882644.1 hydroxyacid dehydrogenase [Murimonas intestini]